MTDAKTSQSEFNSPQTKPVERAQLKPEDSLCRASDGQDKTGDDTNSTSHAPNCSCFDCSLDVNAIKAKKELYLEQDKGEWLSDFEIQWHNKNVIQLRALVKGMKSLLDEMESQKTAQNELNSQESNLGEESEMGDTIRLPPSPDTNSAKSVLKCPEDMNEIEFLEAITKWRSWERMSEFAQANIQQRIDFLKNIQVSGDEPGREEWIE